MTYRTAMERYGSDKPDLRFGMEINDISDIAKDCGFPYFPHNGIGRERSRPARKIHICTFPARIDALTEVVKPIAPGPLRGSA